MTTELKIIENIQKLTWNFEAAKEKIKNDITQYIGLVVNDENLASMEKTQREIASMRTKIQKFKLLVKKDLDKPYEMFELQINELNKLVESAEQPIKDQLQKYEDKRKADKESLCRGIIAEVSEELGLNDKYSNQIVIDSKWINRGTTANSIKEDVQIKVCWFLEIQAQEVAAEIARVAAEAAQTEKINMAKMLIDLLCTSLVNPITFQEVENKLSLLNITEIKTLITDLVNVRKGQEEKAASVALERAEQQRIQEVKRVELAEQARIAEVDKQAKIAEAHAAQLAYKADQEKAKAVKVEPVKQVVTKLYNAQFVAYNLSFEDIEIIKSYFETSGFEFKHAVKEVI